MQKVFTIWSFPQKCLPRFPSWHSWMPWQKPKQEKGATCFPRAKLQDGPKLSHDTCKMRIRAHLGTGNHLHGVSGQHLIKESYSWSPLVCLLSKHSDWRPREGGWVCEKHSHMGTIFPCDSVKSFATQEAASGLACLPSAFLIPSWWARLHGLPSSPECAGADALTLHRADPGPSEFLSNSPHYMPVTTRPRQGLPNM